MSEPDNDEPCGSCEECGIDLYPDDHDYLCAQCEYGTSREVPDERDDGE